MTWPRALIQPLRTRSVNRSRKLKAADQLHDPTAQTVQSSVIRPGIRAKSAVFRVSKTNPCDRAIEAIRRSMVSTRSRRAPRPSRARCGGCVERDDGSRREVAQQPREHGVSAHDIGGLSRPVDGGVTAQDLLMEADDGERKVCPRLLADPRRQGSELRPGLPLEDADVVGIQQILHGSTPSTESSPFRMARPYVRTSSNAGSSLNEPITHSSQSGAICWTRR